MPASDLVANWAYMAIATLAFNIKAWLGLLLPTRAGGAQLLTMDFRRFIHALILILAHIKKGSRRLTFRILSYNRWVRLILEGSQRLRLESARPAPPAKETPMPYVTGRILILIVTATIRLVLIATVLAGSAGARAVHAQGTTTPSWGDVGISVSPLFTVYVHRESCCTPPGGWVTWGTKKFRLQVDYVHNRRRDLIYQDFRGEERQGQTTLSVQRAVVGTHVEQVSVAALYWRLLEHARVSPHLLLGLGYWKFTDRYCVAGGEPVQREPDGRYRVDFAEGEEQRCVDNSPHRWHRIFPQVGVGMDIQIGSRVFARVQAQLLSVRLGVGLRF